MNQVKVCQIKASYNVMFYQILIRSLNEIEISYIAKYKDFKRRYESLVALLMVKHIVREEGVEPGTLLHTPTGKPILEGYDGSISISHIEGDVMVATSTSIKRLGIDIESNIASNIDKSVFMTCKEQELQIQGLTEREKLITIWTLKEAYVKYKETGFLLDPTEIEFGYNDDRWFIEGQNLYIYSCKLPINKIFSFITDQPFIITLVDIEEQKLLE